MIYLERAKYTINSGSTVISLIDVALQHRDHNGHRFHFITSQQDGWHKQAVPRIHKGKYPLRRHRRLHDRHGNMIEGVEFL